MKKDKAVIDVLSSPQLFVFFQHLKTNNWRKLRVNNKVNYFKKLNKLISDTLKIEELELVINEDQICNGNLYDDSMYKNVVVCDDTLTINDVNYNQYLTFYEYLCRVRLYLQEKEFFNETNGFFDAQKMKEIAKVHRISSFGSVNMRVEKGDGHPFEDYQYTNREAREFASAILFEIIKRNYDFNDSYDEEYFMSNCNILDNPFVYEAGEDYLNSSTMYRVYNMYILDNFKKMISKFEDKDLSSIDDNDLFFVVYPSIIKNSDPMLIINAFNEIIKRLYSEEIKIVWNKKGLVINDNIYSISDINNLLNIVLYECLNDMDKVLRNDKDFLSQTIDLEKDILSYKKQWLYNVICKIDKSNSDVEFGVLNYQTIYRLLNKEYLNTILISSNGNHFPHMKRRRK